MKRFWKEVTLAPGDCGWGIELDGRPVRTPAQALLLLPSEALAKAVAEEWRSVEGEIEPQTMQLTGLANAAIDRIAPEREAFALTLARYAEADLACYRAEGPRELVLRQEQRWDPLLAWARRRFDVDFETTFGITHAPQASATIERLAHCVTVLEPFQLAGLSMLVTIGGSLLAGLAVLEKAIAANEAWSLVSVDEEWQLQQWGSDREAERALESRRRDFLAGARFLELLDQC